MPRRVRMYKEATVSYCLFMNKCAQSRVHTREVVAICLAQLEGVDGHKYMQDAILFVPRHSPPGTERLIKGSTMSRSRACIPRWWPSKALESMVVHESWN